MEKPLVAIRCITYNHEPYIRDALEGFVMQKTNFPFVAIVHDDASTDGTAAIIREYAEKYPDIIKPIYETENQYSKKDGALSRIMNKACEGTGAKYIAMCEGDDYWIDPNKLQIQVDFLESHLDYSMCFSNVIVKYENGFHKKNEIFSHLREKDFTASEIITRWTVPTCSAVFRSITLNDLPFNKKFQYGDNVLWLTCSRNGKIHCTDTKMSVYRRNSGGWTSKSSFLCNQMQVLHHIGLYEEFHDLCGLDILNMQRYYYAIAFISGVRTLKIKSIKYFIDGIISFKISYISQILKLITNYILGK